MSTVIPPLQPQDVVAWVGPMAYQRGQWYWRQGRVSHPRRQGEVLKALCQGNASEPYRVWVRLGSSGIVAAGCTCPAGAQGRCKHVAAVLAAWLAAPQRFRLVTPLVHALPTWPSDHLVRLLLAMLDHCPHLEDLLPLYQPISSPSMDKGEDR